MHCALAHWLRGPSGEAPLRSVDDRGIASSTGVDTTLAPAPAECALTAGQRLDIAIGAAAGLAYLHGRDDIAGSEESVRTGTSTAAHAAATVASVKDATGGVSRPDSASATAAEVGAVASESSDVGVASASTSAAARSTLLHGRVAASSIGVALFPDGSMHSKLLDVGLHLFSAAADARAVRCGGAPHAAAPSAVSGYTAPELAETGPSVQTEAFAFGVVLLELLMGRRCHAAVLQELFDDVADAGAAGGPALIAARAEPRVWPSPVAAAMGQLIFECTRASFRRRLSDMASVTARLRDARRVLLMANADLLHLGGSASALSDQYLAAASADAATVMCDACMGDVPAAEALTCPAASAASTEGSAASRPAAGGADGAGTVASARDHASHTICRECLQRHVLAIDATAWARHDRRVPCIAPECVSPGWDFKSLAARLDHRTLILLTGRLSALASPAAKLGAFERSMQHKIARGLGNQSHVLRELGAVAGSGAAGGAGSTTLEARAALLADVIRERDLTLRCPKCSLPYAEATGCNALSCGTKEEATGGACASFGCGAHFCGVCHRLFATSAANHEHHRAAHGHYTDATVLARGRRALRATAAVASLRLFAIGEGGADLQRCVAEALGDAVLADAGLTITSLLEQAEVAGGGAGAAVAGASLTSAIDLLTRLRPPPDAIETVAACAAVSTSAVAGIAAEALPLLSLGLMSTLRRFSEDAVTVKAICDALRRVAAREDARPLVFRDGAVPLLLSALQRQQRDVTVSEAAVRALWNMASASEGKAAIVAAGAVPSLLEALRLHPSSGAFFEAVLGLLRALAVSDDNKVIIPREGAMPLLLAALHRHEADASAVAAICGVLRTLAVNDDNKVSLASSGAVPLLLASLRRHEESADVAEAVCRVFSNLAVNSDNKVLLARDGAIPVLLGALRRHATNVDLTDAACSTLRNLAINDENKAVLAREGAAVLLVDSLQRHASSIAVAKNASGALRLLCKAILRVEPSLRPNLIVATAAARDRHAHVPEIAHAAATIAEMLP